MQSKGSHPHKKYFPGLYCHNFKVHLTFFPQIFALLVLNACMYGVAPSGKLGGVATTLCVCNLWGKCQIYLKIVTI